MKPIEPGQFRLTGLKDKTSAQGWSVKFEHAPEVPDQAAGFLRSQLEGKRRSILSVLNPSEPPRASLLEELVDRGYDMATLRFSIFTKTAARPMPKRLSSAPIRPGYLKARWGRLPDDSRGDLTTTWGLPATRRDSNMLMSVLSQGSYPPHVTREDILRIDPFANSLLDLLGETGFDVRTFRFSVRHASPVPVDE